MIRWCPQALIVCIAAAASCAKAQAEHRARESFTVQVTITKEMLSNQTKAKSGTSAIVSAAQKEVLFRNTASPTVNISYE